MEWMKRLSDDDLRALESGNFAAMSDQGLSVLEQAMPQGLPTTGTVGEEGVTVTPSGMGGTLGEIGRQVGLTARGGIRGAAAIPAMVGDPMMQLINSITGANLPTSSQSLENLMSMVGLPEPRPGLESTVYDVTSAMASVGGPAAAARFSTPGTQQLMAPMTERLGTQTLAAGTAAGAAGTAREAGVGELGQMGAGLTAGLVVPGVAGTLGAGRGVMSAASSPLRASGQERMAGRILADQATDPAAAIARAESFQPSIPGSQPTTAAVTRDYGLASLERTASQLPGASGEYARRLAQNNLARNVLLEKYTADQVLNNAEIKRSAITTPLRTQAFEGATPVKPTRVLTEIDNILASPVGAREVVKETLTGYRQRIQNEMGGRQFGELGADGGFVDPARLYSIRQDIADTLEGVLVGSRVENVKNVASGPLIQLRNVLDEVIESGAPGYRDYMQTYATMSRPVNQIRTMHNIVDKASGGTVDPTTGVRNFTPVRFGKLVDQLEADPRNPLSKTQMGVLKRVTNELDEGAITGLAGVRPAGSDTFKNLTVAHLLGSVNANPQSRGLAADMINRFAKPISWVYGGSEDAVRQLVIDAMLDPKIAAQLMRKATEPNIEQISRSLFEIASQAAYGPAFGINVQQMELQ